MRRSDTPAIDGQSGLVTNGRHVSLLTRTVAVAMILRRAVAPRHGSLFDVDLRNNSGNLAKFAAMRRTSSAVRTLGDGATAGLVVEIEIGGRLSLPSLTIEAVAHIRTDDEFAVALDDVVPSAAPVKLRLPHRRSGARSLLHGRRVDRNGACALTAEDTNGAGEA